jgi:Antitoxin of toxin-antitoxin stability system
MTKMSVGEFKTKFSTVLDLIKNGEEVEILYGRNKDPIAKLVPLNTKNQESLLGALEGKATYTMADDWKITSEELLDL